MVRDKKIKDYRVRVLLDYENSEVVQQIMYKTNRSATSIVNELLRKIEIVIPEKNKIKLSEEMRT